MKKQQTLISAEEEHLVTMSNSGTATTSTKVKKVKKASNKSVLKKTGTVLSTEEETFPENNKSGRTITSEIHTVKKATMSEHQREQVDSSTLDNGAKNVQVNDIQDKKKKTKSKKTKKSEIGAQSISVKSSFSKFDALQKKNLQQEDNNNLCKLCSKAVYKMEEIKAEKNVYHKNCFRCNECNKQLKVDNYQSNEGLPYCIIHFKLLFAPKIVEDNESEKPSKPELIIRENQPVDLPPDVVRASNVPDLGLEDLHQLNVRSRFQVFEKGTQQKSNEQLLPLEDRPTHIKLSTSILSKVAKLQARGFSVDGESITVENSGSDPEDSSSSIENDAEDGDLVRSKKRTRERPVGIGKAMDDIKTKFEKGPLFSKDERREERKQEIQNIRSRLFMGKQAKIKEMYQQAVADSEQSILSSGKKTEVEVDGVTRSLKERFEKGDIFKSNNVDDDNEILKGNAIDDIKAESSEILEKFKFFESYKPTASQKKQFRITPPQEGVVKIPSPDNNDQDHHAQNNYNNNGETYLLETSGTTAKMLDKFREMEKNKNRGQNNGPRPLKSFTPPPEGDKRLYQPDESDQESNDGSGESSVEEEEDNSDVDAMRRSKLLADDEALKEARAAARAKQLRAKFEKWEANEIQRETHDDRSDIFSQSVSEENIESTKSIRERFENMKTAEARTPVRPRHQVNRFV